MRCAARSSPFAPARCRTPAAPRTRPACATLGRCPGEIPAQGAHCAPCRTGRCRRCRAAWTCRSSPCGERKSPCAAASTGRTANGASPHWQRCNPRWGRSAPRPATGCGARPPRAAPCAACRAARRPEGQPGRAGARAPGGVSAETCPASARRAAPGWAARASAPGPQSARVPARAGPRRRCRSPRPGRPRGTSRKFRMPQGRCGATG
mmetsp:Transcript_7972/g.26230  ORF Transcript_7972/g.26230 Transcript_7972/m.26230 type:complete len:208 (+) Transcript_7972:899-1522(+)